MSSGSKARMTSDRNDPRGGGSARSTEEAGQCPPRKGAEQDSLFDEGYTAAPEADKTVSTKLAGLVARARKEARLTNVVQVCGRGATAPGFCLPAQAGGT